MEKIFEKAAKIDNLARAWLSSRAGGTPAFVRMIPTDRCNLNCAYCWQKDNSSTDMSFDQFAAHLAKARELRVGLLTFLGGEPMLWEPLYDAVALCTKNHILTDLTTNGTLLDAGSIEKLGRAGLDFLNVSVDGTVSSPVTRKTTAFREGVVDALREARSRHHMHFRFNSVIYRNNFEDVCRLMDFCRSRDIQLSLGFIVPPLDPALRSREDIYFSLDDEPLLHTMVDEILLRKRAGCPVIDPDSYFENVFRFLRRERFWECNYPTRYGWINVTPSGRIRSCTKKMDELEFLFLDLEKKSLKRLRKALERKVASCNMDCYSNCAYDSYFYTHNKGAMMKKVLHRLVGRSPL